MRSGPVFKSGEGRQAKGADELLAMSHLQVAQNTRDRVRYPEHAPNLGPRPLGNSDFIALAPNAGPASRRIFRPMLPSVGWDDRWT
jgi:hypothetical protein